MLTSQTNLQAGSLEKSPATWPFYTEIVLFLQVLHPFPSLSERLDSRRQMKRKSYVFLSLPRTSQKVRVYPILTLVFLSFSMSLVSFWRR